MRWWPTLEVVPASEQTVVQHYRRLWLDRDRPARLPRSSEVERRWIASEWAVIQALTAADGAVCWADLKYRFPAGRKCDIVVSARSFNAVNQLR
jgi:hypothetical protein